MTVEINGDRVHKGTLFFIKYIHKQNYIISQMYADIFFYTQLLYSFFNKPIIMEKYCKTCGRVFKDSDYKICPYCGHELSEREGRQPIPRKLRHQVFQRDNYRCKECGATNKETRLHVDHIVPVAKGGTNDLSNLQTLCEACNRAKYTDEWVGGVIGSESYSLEPFSLSSKNDNCPHCGSVRIIVKSRTMKYYYCENCCTEIKKNDCCPHCGSIRVIVKSRTMKYYYCENCCTEIKNCSEAKNKTNTRESKSSNSIYNNKYPIWGI